MLCLNEDFSIKWSYRGGEPSHSLVVIVDEHVGLRSSKLFKHMQEEVLNVDIHKLPVIRKLHLKKDRKKKNTYIFFLNLN